MTKPEILPCREAFEKWYKSYDQKDAAKGDLSWHREAAYISWQAAWERAPQVSVPDGVEQARQKWEVDFNNLTSEDCDKIEQTALELLRISTPTKVE